MLINLHVKNLALIKEVDVDLTDGLLVLTGETGAGKSLILGSVNIALGNKAAKEMIRNDSDYALVELTFLVDKRCAEKLKSFDIYMENEQQSENKIVTITRKITEGRSVSKINGETVNLKTLKQVMTLLVDIHGQHDHQSLLYKSNHMSILDKFASVSEGDIPRLLSENYNENCKLKDSLKQYEMDETLRLRELEFAEFEVNEIDEAALVEGEDEELEEEFKKLSNSKLIINNLSEIYNCLSYESESGVGEGITRAISEIKEIKGFDEKIDKFQSQLYDIDSMCRDLTREIYDYNSQLNFEPDRIYQLEERLNLINHLKLKYGQSIHSIIKYRDEKQKYIDKLKNYQMEIEYINNKIQTSDKELNRLCEQLSDKRKSAAKQLEKEVSSALQELNFITVEFRINISKKEKITVNGFDEVEFMISTNPGEPIKPLAKIASGGELSRIMLAIKSILAKEDEIYTLIFDEIDIGISGITAQMVAKKLSAISKDHQVICISHLAQIAAMADNHYLIEKMTEKNETMTSIHRLDYDSSIDELVRINGSGKNTETSRKHAIEMKELADKTKIS